MRIGIDISQLAFENTGVANYLKNLVEHLVEQDTKNEYVLFYSSLRKDLPESKVWKNGGKIKDEFLPKVASLTIAQHRFPPVFLEFLWNRLHIFPMERLLGPIDIFLSSDWVQPPTKAKKITILYDLIVYKYPEETHNQVGFSLRNLIFSANIVASQKRRLKWVKKEVDKILCISEATKRDAEEILSIPQEKLDVVYPGF